MGYFSNGTAGTMFWEKNCAKCWHDRNNDCPECNNPHSMLHSLIPRDKDGWNEQCRMFVPRDAVTERANDD